MGKKKNKSSRDPGGFQVLADQLKGIKPSGAAAPPAPPEPPKKAPASTFLMSPEAQMWLEEEERPRSAKTPALRKQGTTKTSAKPVKEVDKQAQEQEALRAQIAQLEQEIENQTQEIEKLRQDASQEAQRAQRYLQEREEARKQLEETQKQQEEALRPPPHTSLADLLIQRGIPANLHEDAARHVLQRDTPRLLEWLGGDPASLGPWLQKYLRLSCADPLCQQELRDQGGYPMLTQDPAQCECCQNTDSRRMATRFARACRERGLYRVVLVGGSPTTHAELQQLPLQGIQLKLIDGKQNRDLQQATNDMRHNHLVIIWASTMIQHKVSKLYTDQQNQHETKLIVAEPRGLAQMLREVLETLQTP